jgi:hypothetical protein
MMRRVSLQKRQEAVGGKDDHKELGKTCQGGHIPDLSRWHGVEGAKVAESG